MYISKEKWYIIHLMLTLGLVHIITAEISVTMNNKDVSSEIYERSFNKYHHARKINFKRDRNNEKRSFYKRQTENIPNPVEFATSSIIDKTVGIRTIENNPETVRDILDNSIPNSVGTIKKLSSEGTDVIYNGQTSVENGGKEESTTERNLKVEMKKYNVKPGRKYYTQPQITTPNGPKRICLHKYDSVLQTHKVSSDIASASDGMYQYIDDEYDSAVVEPSTPYEARLPDGSRALVEACNYGIDECYTFWKIVDNQTVTILGQGCWKASLGSRDDCSSKDCKGRQSSSPNANFCCCHGDYCNDHFTISEANRITTQEPIIDAHTHVKYDWSNYVYILVIVTLVSVSLLALYIVRRRRYIRKRLSKVESANSGHDELSTGLCVDNLVLLEHIGTGKFGSVWRGSLGATPVAVKLYNSPDNCQKEASIYSLPFMTHDNLLYFYGSESRPLLTESSGRQHMVVLELCVSTLQDRLKNAPVSWPEFADIGHGLSSALAHLHTPCIANGATKPCIVHRDISSRNVLIDTQGRVKLADLGLAMTLYANSPTAGGICEAGTWRYLSPEALEGAVDLCAPRAALSAVDVYALGVVLWEALWCIYSCYRVPFDNATDQTSLQNLVSRQKWRPPLPRQAPSGSSVANAESIACDTCHECWDHDAEARLTAVCVVERFVLMKQLLKPHAPRPREDNLHPNRSEPALITTPIETDKNSNCINSLVYNQPQIGRNTCIERNTHNQSDPDLNLIHRSLKDTQHIENQLNQITNIDENCISVARVPSRRIYNHDMDRTNEHRTVQRPLAYVQNDVNSRAEDNLRIKDTNLRNDRSKWSFKGFFSRNNARNNSSPLETEVKLLNECLNQNSNQIVTSVVGDKALNVNERPSNLSVSQDYHFENPCTLSPPNRTLSPTMMENRRGSDEVDTPKPSQIFAVIVPKCDMYKDNLIEMNSRSTDKNSLDSIKAGHSIISLNSDSESSLKNKRLSSDDKVSSSSCSFENVELKFMSNNECSFELNTDCSSSSEDEHLMLLSENGHSKIILHQGGDSVKKILSSEILCDTNMSKGNLFIQQNGYHNFNGERSDSAEKENYGGENPLYFASYRNENECKNNIETKSPKSSLKSLDIKRQHSLEQVSELFSSSCDLSHLQNPANRVKTPGDLPVAIRNARRDKVLQKGRSFDSNRLSLYDDRIMFGNSL